MSQMLDLQNFSKVIGDSCVVIWGLNNFEHSHSYIHLNYFKVLRRNKIPVLWLDDQKCNQNLVPQNAVVIYVGFASQHLPHRSDLSYFAHNVSPSQRLFMQNLKVMFYENFKKSSAGIPHRLASLSLWNPRTQTLSQPYGTPIPIEQWRDLSPVSLSRGAENWVGSVWNDDMNRGNSESIKHYVCALNKLGIKFRQIELGKISKLPFGPSIERTLIAQSVFGASIHSDFQISESNIVCRFFKNFSFGKLPMTNQTCVSTYLEGLSLVNSNLETLIEQRLSIGREEERNMFQAARSSLRHYTYESSLERMANAFRGEWNES
jgi:hypothetical protein